MLNLSIANLIKKQAEKNPDAICIAAPSRKPLTYRGLYNCIEDIGAYFQAMGLGRNDRVAIALPNSPEMAVAFLAVAAFCTCAPLNPNYRAVEFDFYLSDLQAKALIVQSGIDSEASSVATKLGIPILELSPILEAEAGIFSFKGVNKHSNFSGSFASTDDVALVLHTSGTTARPKIVPLTHANLCTSANNIQTTLKLSEEDCCLNVMPLFHIHGLIGTLLSSLASGGSVVCTPRFDATKFFDWLLEFKPTWYSAVPTIHQAILAKADAARSIINNCSIRLIRSSSAALPPQVMIALEEIFNAPVIEAYGMTEASHQMASNPLPPAVRKPGSVGIPTGLEIAIMDEFGNFLEPGTVGEIVIQGGNVTSGYDNPQANISAFTNGWFRTGDNGYFDSDGYLYINGRIKEIINRGGEKISPREVDEVLLNHLAVAQAVTFAVPHPTLGEDVAAAVVLHENVTVTEKEIYEFANSFLADFKLPAQVVFVDEIPLGATGKLQRIGLADKLASKLKAAFVEPRNEIEKNLAEIWSEVLGIEIVGIYDNFFALGGDSLRANQVIARIEAQNQVEINFFDFFAAPTIINLSQIIKGVAGKNVDSGSKQIISQNNYDYPLPLSSAQQRFWFLAQLAPESPVYNVANAMEISGNLKVEFLQQAINAIVERHAVLRSTIKLLDDQLVQIITSHQIVLQQVALDSDSLKRFIDEEIQRPFDLEQGPLLRVTLLKLDKAKHILLLVNHHIISDDWSIGLFWQEFTALYEAFSTQQASKLQPLPLQYADFAVWQHNYLQDEYLPSQLQSQLNYWKQQLSGELPLLQLPIDRVRPRVETYKGSWESFTISQSKTSGLKNLSKSEGVTLFMTLLAAFKTLLYRYSNQEDILISIPISERNQVETEGLIGCFINNLVLRTNLEGNPSFQKLLQIVKKTAIEAYAHRHLPFEKIIQQLQVERHISQLPFQVMFVLHNAPKAVLSVRNLTLKTLPIYTATAKLDLSLELQETSEGITGRLEYNTDLFDATTITRMVEHFQILLNGVITNPYQAISKLPLLTATEQHQLFKKQIENSSDADAVALESEQLMSRQFSCFLIGDETLVIAASEILLKSNHEILGIITNNKAVSEFASTKNIPCIPIDENLVKFLSTYQFDYLFSIYNLYILPQQIIDLPRKMAINCHNSLLPKYGGRNATSWAIINREKIHGVTWHAMTTLVDRGDILKQLPIEISNLETAFTLKTKSFSCIVESFGELVDELANNKLSLIPQNLQDKSYFLSHQKPTPGCIISWECCAHDLNALIRGLDFNIFPNPIGLLKVYIDTKFFIVSNLEVLSIGSKMPSGTVTKITECGIQVSTLSNEVVLSGLKALDGQPISICDLVINCGLHEGYRFSEPNSNIINSIDKLEVLISKHEEFWLERLSTLNLVSLPQMNQNATTEIKQEHLSLNMLFPSVVNSFLKEKSSGHAGDFLVVALMAYLSRITGELSFDVGFSYSDVQSEIEELENFFATYVPCRIDTVIGQSFANFFDSVQEQVEVIKRHKTFAHDMVVRYPTLRKGLDIQKNDTFPIVVEQVKQLKDTKAYNGHNLIIAMTEDGTECCWIYDSKSFTTDTIERMVSQFAIFLQGIVTNASASISELPLLTEIERHQMLVEWNNQKANYPIDKCIHQLFETQIEQNPEAIAVVFENQQLTYRELNCRANQLAHYLQSLGVKPEVLVGICIERSIEMLVGILGILKAGGAYVPLDPTYPSERLNYMLKDSKVPVLLTMATLVEKLPQHQTSVVCLDTDWKKIASSCESNPISLVVPDNLAYVIYTSGSTGKPKGVLIQHKSLVNYTWVASAEYSISKRDRVLQFASINFDASAEEIYTCLTRGATLVLRTDSMLDSVDIFLQKCLDLKLTVLALPTAYWHELTSICSQQNLVFPQLLRLVIIGGEKALPERLKTWFEYVGQRVRLVNSYGPTEATIVTTIYDLSVANPASTELPIGRPIANVQTYILDRYQQPLPIGVPGELYIAGDGLARGYLNQSDLTDEKFIPNPFDQKPGRLYKTGDLVRYLPDGNIELLGRIDNQVKVRGFRIELNEIESKLAKHSKVKETVVIAREHIAGEKELVAYIVFDTELAPTIGDLRRFLKEQLPDYMVPSAFVTLDALPLTPNGKVDRSALPSPDLHSILKHKFVAPRTPIEERLAQIWAQVLKLELVGINDNFFELGGHSLLAVRLIIQIEQQLGKKLSIATLFQTPTIKQLACVIHQENSVSSIIEITPLNGYITPLFWCTPHLNYNLNLLAKYIGTSQPLFGLDSGYFQIENPDTHIKDYAARYVEEIRVIQPNGPYKLGGYCMGGILAFEIAQQLRAQGEQCDMLALVERSGLNRIHRYCTNISVAIDGHRNNLAQLNHTQQIIYIAKLIKKIFIRSLSKFRKNLNLNQQEYILNTNTINTTFIQQRAIGSIKKYYSQKPYPGNIILLFAENNNYNYLSFFFPKYGWSKAVTGKIDISLVSGNHVSVTEEPHIQEVAAKLKSYLVNFDDARYKEKFF